MALHTHYEIRWKNFRGFEDTGWIKISPLTILIGPNNSGKTTLSMPLLLLSQTMASRDAKTPLLTRGQNLSLGSFKDIVFNHDTEKDIFFGFKYHLHPKDKIDGKIGSWPPGVFEVTLGTGVDFEDIILKQFSVYDVFERLYMAHTRQNDGSYAVESEFLKKMTDQERDALKASKPTNFLFSPIPIMRALDQPETEGADAEKIKPEAFSRNLTHYVRALRWMFDEVGATLRRVNYIGPIRDKPQRHYELSTEAMETVGSHGENVANLIRQHISTAGPELDSWIEQFGFGKGLRVGRVTNDVFSLYFKRGGKRGDTNIADAGFGASQILPLIVQAVMARRGGLTIAEQPEIHLNPKLQCLVADLCVATAKRDHRVLIETHSEHILLRIRKLIAEGKISSADVSVYFVEKHKGVSEIRQIPIDDFGHTSAEEWPRDFFADSLRESFELAKEQINRKKREAANANKTP